MAELNLPLWRETTEQKERIAKALLKANTTASEIISSFPNIDLSDFKNTVNSILSTGTISSLEDAANVAGTPNPSPYQEDLESDLDKTGYVIFNKKNVYKIDNASNNVEAIRMLYNAGMSIKELRKKLESLEVSSTIVVKVKTKFSKFSYSQKELLHNTNVRFYKEYFASDSSNYLASDYIVEGNDYDGIYAVVCEQDSSSYAYLYCPKIDSEDFPLNGSLDMFVDDVNYTIEFTNVHSGEQAACLLSTILPSTMSVSYESGLKFKCTKSFYFTSDSDIDLLVKLNIKSALISAQRAMKLGYSGVSILENEIYPYNCEISKTNESSSNVKKIYKELLSKEFPQEDAFCYLTGNEMYSDLQSYLDKIKSGESFDLTKEKNSNFYRKVNTRIVATTSLAISNLLALSDTDLEYLLRYREDVLGIDFTYSKSECISAIINTMTVSSSGSSYQNESINETDAWKANTSQARYMGICLWLSESSSSSKDSENYLDKYYDFLNSVTAYTISTYSTSSTYSYSEISNGTEVMLVADGSALFSIDNGMQFFENLYSELSFSEIEEFEATMQIVQGYLNSAFSVFNASVSTFSGLISLLNSSISVISGSGTASLGVPSVLQCSLSVDAAIVIPPFLSSLSLLLVPIIDDLELFIEGLIKFQDTILCPIQNLLDRYLNTSNFVLPCRITYSVPTISNISSYLQGYVQSLNFLKASCASVKKDASWLKFKATSLPGAVSLIVTNSSSCKES